VIDGSEKDYSVIMPDVLQRLQLRLEMNYGAIGAALH
jgi:hypothetical protein